MILYYRAIGTRGPSKQGKPAPTAGLAISEFSKSAKYMRLYHQAVPELTLKPLQTNKVAIYISIYIYIYLYLYMPISPLKEPYLYPLSNKRAGLLKGTPEDVQQRRWQRLGGPAQGHGGHGGGVLRPRLAGPAKGFLGGSIGNPRFPLKGSFKGDRDIDTWLSGLLLRNLN